MFKFALITIYVLCLLTNGFAQCKAQTLDTLISSVGKHFDEKDLAGFSCLFNVESAQSLVKDIRDEEFSGVVPKSKFEFGKVIHADNKKALIFFAGLVEFGNSGYETVVSRDFTGIYEAEFSGDSWKVKRLVSHKINDIRSHDLDLRITPGKKLQVRDILTADVKGDFGFLVGLNHRAKFSKVLVGGRPANYKFGGGMLWVEALPGRDVEISLEYEFPEIDTDEKENDRNSSYWGEEFGHVRNQFMWHPFYDFVDKANFARFTVKAQIPKAYQLVLDIPTREKIVGENRIITAETEENTNALSLLYDKNWKVSRKHFGQIRLDIYATDSFLPGIAEIQKEFENAYGELKKRFGEPVSRQFKIIQSRGRSGNGWHYRSNNAIVAGSAGGNLISKSPVPRAYFAHEVAHAWTEPTGNASNFLREGWASFAEGIFLNQRFGKEIEAKMYERYFSVYKDGGFDGKISILEDTSNSGVSYYKGAWIFKMLRDFVGEEEFQKGMRRYISQSRNGNSDLESFISAFEKEPKENVRKFLLPWLEGNTLPNLKAELADKKIEITQLGDVFYLPLEVEFTTENQSVRKSFMITKKTQIFSIEGMGEVRSVRL
ncbi:MAG: hypothetical protein KDB79_02090, partial [Acidobacteria bacterium]|nr:hypothetical protein [Acidobacteriota bacterium]